MKSRTLRIAQTLFLLLVLLVAMDADARGRGGGGRRGGGFQGARNSGISRQGPASWGSVRHSQPSRSRSGSMNRQSRTQSGTFSRETQRGGTHEGTRDRDGNTTTREGTYTGPGGETIDYSTSRTRTEDGISRSGSFETSTGATGGGSAEVKLGNDGFESAERSRHIETADGETGTREISSERDGDWVVREGEIKTSTGIDAESAGAIKKTDDGFIARGAIEGDDYAAVGTIVKDGDDFYVRGAATDGDEVTWGRAHCDGGKCYGGRVTADIDSYYYYPYYYYPYYYAYYACPAGTSTVITGYYGTPVYSCSHTVIIHTTFMTQSSSQSSGVEVAVTSSPVVMYELSKDVVVYSTSYEPQGVYSVKKDGRYFWPPGLAEDSPEAGEWIEQAAEIEQPSANASVIIYTIGDRSVYLTNESPVTGIHFERSGALFVWIPGVRDPSAEERDAIATAITAHGEGGSSALEAEVRKLQDERSPPPSAAGADSAAR
ncbi:MAG: hypothetical protein JRG89_11585 [Deltaproteobacteria bacterium]|nr:hypothetical protein [Deltaproteobacteria bacterium]MBW2724277.1 hypothetical protein [Deltaproteobacteria bacterium]